MNIQKVNKICMGIRMFALVNFNSLIIGAILLGGDAATGYTRLGHYFLSLGFLKTEVSYSVFNYSLVHFYSFFAVTMPIWIVSELVWLYFNMQVKLNPDKEKEKEKDKDPKTRLK